MERWCGGPNPISRSCPCFETVNATCAITPACKLRGALHLARDAFLAVLDSFSLADLVENREALRELLAAGSSRPVAPDNRTPGRHVTLQE